MLPCRNGEDAISRTNKFKKDNGGSSVSFITFVQRIRYNLILSSLEKLRGDVLDVGCGRGTLGRMLEINGMHVTYLDIDKITSLKYLGNKEMVVADGSALPFRDKSFDFTTSTDTLEHLPQSKREAFVAELVRCAKRRVVFTFCQLHKQNPKKCGILLFEFFYRLFKLPDPDWYEEHSAHEIPHLNRFKDIIRYSGAALHQKAYYGLLTLFLQASLGALMSRRYKVDRQASNTFARYPIFLMFLNYFFYFVLSIIDIPPYYSIAVEVRLEPSDICQRKRQQGQLHP